MDLLQNAFTEALARNSDEKEKWTRYLEDHQKASTNLEHFRKSIDVEVMVPIGSKAMMPGKLYHTNEIFLSHSSQIYSKCTAHQSMEVCAHRISVAQQRLDDLETERELYQNKLDLPMNEDVFQSSSGEQEIIEDYNEEAELKWREKHRASIRRQKQTERKQREAFCDGDIDVNEILDELELMEELDYELESMNIDTDDKLEKILSGDVVVPAEKKRVSHAAPTAATTEATKSISPAPSSESSSTLSTMSTMYESMSEVQSVDSSESSDSEDEETDEGDEDIPEELKAYRLEAEGMTDAEKIKYYSKKLFEVEYYLRLNTVKTFEDFVRKTDRMFVCDHLQCEIDRLADIVGSQPVEKVKKKKKKSSKHHTRTVSFGIDQIASFSKFQAPSRVSKDLKRETEDNQTDEEDPKADEVNPSLSSDQLDEKERLKEYVKKVAAMDPHQVTEAMKTHHQEQTILKSKSILKNKEAVEDEFRILDQPPDHEDGDKKNDHHKKSKKNAHTKMEHLKKAEDDNQNPLMEFDKIMGDIFERTVAKPLDNQVVSETHQPDPLPCGTFWNAYEPKARVSRFKASREKHTD